MTSFALIPVAAFLGSFHCVAMCGPFIGYYSLGIPNTNWLHHGLYQVGRLTAYLALGSLAGLFGQGLFALGATLEIQRWVMIVLGAVMVLIGIAHIIGLPARAPKSINRLVHGMLGKRAQTATPLLIGLMTSILPCGYLYAFVFAAAATGHPVSAVAVMALFWLGTLPALAVISACTGWAGPRLWRTLSKITPLFLIAFGVLAIWGKWLTFPQLQNQVDQLCHGIGL